MLFTCTEEFIACAECPRSSFPACGGGRMFFLFERFFFFFDVDHFLKSFLNLLQHCFCLIFWFSGFKVCEILAPRSVFQAAPPALKGEVLTTRPPRKSQECSLCINHLRTLYIFLGLQQPGPWIFFSAFLHVSGAGSNVNSWPGKQIPKAYYGLPKMD